MAGLDDEGEEHPCKVPRTSRSNSSVWDSNTREGDPCATSVEDLSVPSLGLPFSCEQGSGVSKSADQEEDRIKTLLDLALTRRRPPGFTPLRPAYDKHRPVIEEPEIMGVEIFDADDYRRLTNSRLAQEHPRVCWSTESKHYRKGHEG
jgi:hypothetical protein